MRKTFVKELIKLAEYNNRLLLVVGDVGYSLVEEFQHNFPNQFINAGIAEQNMTGVSAGLASEGFNVFLYSIANFSTFRCAEQIRNDVAYHNLAVTIVSVGGGLCYGNAGYSHHLVQDYALIRVFPNMTILSPGDCNEVSECLNYIKRNRGPYYLRLSHRNDFIQNSKCSALEPGKWVGYRRNYGNTKAIVTTGSALPIVLDIMKNRNSNDYDIYSCPIWSLKAKELQQAQLEKYDKIITVEEHFYEGGFGSWMLESSSQCNFIHNDPVIKTAAYDSSVYNQTGSYEELLEKSGLVKKLLQILDD